MQSVKTSAVAPRKSPLFRVFAKVLRIRGAAGVSPHEELTEKAKASDNNISLFFDDCDEQKLSNAIKEAFVAKLFAGISTVKDAHAHLQLAEAPYDADGIQSSDQTIVSELKKLSELKYCYLNKLLKDFSPENTIVLAEIEELKSLSKTYKVTGKNLDYQLKLNDSEITFLKEKLEEAESENKLLETWFAVAVAGNRTEATIPVPLQ